MKKVIVIEESCISCGICEAMAPDIFEIDGVSTVVNSEVTSENEELINNVVNDCPTSAIEVTEN